MFEKCAAMYGGNQETIRPISPIHLILRSWLLPENHPQQDSEDCPEDRRDRDTSQKTLVEVDIRSRSWGRRYIKNLALLTPLSHFIIAFFRYTPHRTTTQITATIPAHMSPPMATATKQPRNINRSPSRGTSLVLLRERVRCRVSAGHHASP